PRPPLKIFSPFEQRNCSGRNFLKSCRGFAKADRLDHDDGLLLVRRGAQAMGKQRWLVITGLVAMGAFSSAVTAGEYNKVLSIGDAAPAWSDLPGTDGKLHSLADLAEKPVVVVVFTCISCPTAADYEDRIQALAQTY